MIEPNTQLLLSSSPGRAGFTQSDLLASLLVLFALVAVAFNVQRRVASNARATLCQNNLQQIGRSVLQFANEHGSKLPGILHSDLGDPWWWYKEQVKGYLGLTAPSSEADQVFACPMDRGYSDPGPFSKNQ